MNRREFIAVLAALPFVPEALAPLLKRAQIAAQMRHQAVTCMATDPIHGIMQRAYRKMQGDLLEGLKFSTEEWDWFDEKPCPMTVVRDPS